MTRATRPYADAIATIEELPTMLRIVRRLRGISLRTAAEEIGISFSTVDRIERGEECYLSAALACLRWVDRPPG